MAWAGPVPTEGIVLMIGRIDSTKDRWPALLAIAALIALAGPAARAQGPRAQLKGVAPAPTEPPVLYPTGPGAGSMALPPPAEPQPKLDLRVQPAEADDKGGLPEAKLPPGGVPPGSGRHSGPADDPYTLHPDRLTAGKQRVQLSVEVRASPVINLGKEATVRLVVTNESSNDASGVSVVYQLPEGLQLLSSTPEATPVPADKALFHWKKSMLAAGGEWVIVLKVLAKEARACDHSAVVTAKTGSRAHTTVQEPKLKVEVNASPGRLLKGNQVTFTIAVRNPGTGPARNVIVQAKLSSGLRQGNDDVLEQPIAEIKPGEMKELDPLIVDSVAGGQQTCTVEARSPDVNTVVEDHRVTRIIDVTRPELAVKLTGPDVRFTGQTGEYKLTVTNPGTAAAKKVKVAVALPQQGGKLVALPDRASFIKESRKLLWTLDQVEPGLSVEMTFVYLTSTPGLYRATAEATSGELRSSDAMSTEVSGIAVLDLQVTQTARVIDVGKTTIYDITIKNVGSKEATRLQLSGNLTKNLKVLQHFNVEKGQFQFNLQSGQFLFPEIDRLAVGQSITLGLEVQATESGPGGCHVFLAHAEMGAENDAKVEDVVSTTITGSGRPRPK
jgi:uncharacterized repeat protein (TIGR01451 family)